MDHEETRKKYVGGKNFCFSIKFKCGHHFTTDYFYYYSCELFVPASTEKSQSVSLSSLIPHSLLSCSYHT
jgi:hypothetical protein